MSLLRSALWIYRLLMLHVLVVAALLGADERPVVLIAVPVLWTCARLAADGQPGGLVLGAFAVPAWWLFALRWFPCGHSGQRADTVMVLELGVLPVAAMLLGAAAAVHRFGPIWGFGALLGIAAGASAWMLLG